MNYFQSSSPSQSRIIACLCGFLVSATAMAVEIQPLGSDAEVAQRVDSELSSQVWPESEQVEISDRVAQDESLVLHEASASIVAEGKTIPTLILTRKAEQATQVLTLIGNTSLSDSAQLGAAAEALGHLPRIGVHRINLSQYWGGRLMGLIRSWVYRVRERIYGPKFDLYDAVDLMEAQQGDLVDSSSHVFDASEGHEISLYQNIDFLIPLSASSRSMLGLAGGQAAGVVFLVVNVNVASAAGLVLNSLGIVYYGAALALENYDDTQAYQNVFFPGALQRARQRNLIQNIETQFEQLIQEADPVLMSENESAPEVHLAVLTDTSLKRLERMLMKQGFAESKVSQVDTLP